jgi:hypothetical protein
MKTTMKFLGMGLALIALTLTSCSKDGETGSIGPAGKDGINGTNGSDGANGQDGEDGNANVIASDWATADFGSYSALGVASFTINDSRITSDVLNSYGLIGFMSFGTDPNGDVYAIPFTEDFLRTFSAQHRLGLGKYTVSLLRSTNAPAGTTPVSGTLVRFVLVAPSSVAGKGNATGKDGIAQMMANGVDTNNYMEVIDYLGLDY